MLADVLDETVDLEPGDCVGRVQTTLGNDMWEVCLADGAVLTVRLPSRYKKKVWVKRESFVVVRMDGAGEEGSAGVRGRSYGEIVHILFDRHVRSLVARGLFPACWRAELGARDAGEPAELGESGAASGSGSQQDDFLADLVANPNRRCLGEDESD